MLQGFHEAGTCDETTWPDKDHGLVCGECKVLVNNMASTYGGKCDTYCAGLEKQCVGAWEEIGDTCVVDYDGACSVSLGGTSDAICECSADGAPCFLPSRDAFIYGFIHDLKTHNL